MSHVIFFTIKNQFAQEIHEVNRKKPGNELLLYHYLSFNKEVNGFEDQN